MTNEYEQCMTENARLQLLLDQETQEKEQAQQDLKNKSNFVAFLSHEIRNPANGIVAMSQLLGETELTEEQQSYLEIIQASNDSLMELINGILDISRLEAGKMTVTTNPFDLINTIEDLIYMLAPQAFEKEVEIILDIESEIPLFVVGDSLKLRQIFLNLIQNSIKFTHTGQIVFELKRVPSLQNDRINVCFAVRDTGIGMSEDQVSKIFDVYAQVHEASEHNYGGTGLGLAITKNLIELLDGKIEVLSEKGKGTSVEINLSFERYTDIPSIPFEDDVLTDMRFLLLEQHPLSRHVIASMLEGWGAIVECAEEATEALTHRTRQGEFDVVLADLKTVDEDEEFYTLSEIKGVNVFLLARLGEKVEDEKRSRFRSIITKPIRKLHLLNAILAMDKNVQE
ncbi:ATP-binding protein [Saccharibacillus sp. JS10]|uniref:ATP-binding response regulator n=1 Tax=Saccharibacillus sp. JS10 TaxID=2950552 RepID=UPI00210E5670|nr:ATP-binding protein [Saccharibacillus sp. JS10]MCQ4088362.1 ATP-binding protein [Saccharibacillus sp. JS10]